MRNLFGYSEYNRNFLENMTYLKQDSATRILFLKNSTIIKTYGRRSAMYDFVYSTLEYVANIPEKLWNKN